ncbi:MAG TPA: FHA domain-containing protein [Ktedonobacteraceae bacterium]|jgi:pSer/pThr/pTyr-binding forkhead associated (FHA) protein/limonene-1,2-epoxide hydrolase|nr:FHA domain-containing protein [Ktedonobacteraceae bacterium]
MQAALNGPMGRTILESAVLSIGSSPDNQLVLHDANVAEYQAEIRPDGQGYSITDLGSGSGTFVNGQRLAWDMPRKLNPGDMITIGDTTFTYETANTSPSQTGSEQAQVVSPVETVQPGAEENRQQETPQQDHSVAAGFFPAAFNASEHTAYGPSTPEVPGQAPGAAPTYGPSTPPTDGLIYAPPFPQPVYQGGMPGYPGAEPAAPTPAPPQPARRRTWLWISLVALVVLIAGGAALFYFTRPSPEKTLDAYCQALQAQNYVAAYNQLATSLQNMETEPQYAAILQALGKTTSCMHGSANIIANTATATLTLITSGHTYRGTVTLLQDSSNNWKISILLSSPEMTMTTFCNALASGDYQTAYSTLSSDLKSRNSETQFETDFAGLTCSYSKIIVSGINAAANAIFTGGSGSAPAIILLTEDHNSNNDWKINGIQ